MVGTLVRRCRCATSWGDRDLTFGLVVLTISLKINLVRTVRCRRLTLSSSDKDGKPDSWFLFDL